MVVCRPNRREEIKNFVLKAGDYIIEQKEKIKVLGVFFTSALATTLIYLTLFQRLIIECIR